MSCKALDPVEAAAAAAAAAAFDGMPENTLVPEDDVYSWMTPASALRVTRLWRASVTHGRHAAG
jgi:hypothetical protein